MFRIDDFINCIEIVILERNLIALNPSFADVGGLLQIINLSLVVFFIQMMFVFTTTFAEFSIEILFVLVVLCINFLFLLNISVK